MLRLAQAMFLGSFFETMSACLETQQAFFNIPGITAVLFLITSVNSSEKSYIY